MMFEILRSALIEFGVDVKNFKVDETGKATFEIDFSEHDKKVAEEKDKKIAELERDLKECKDEVIAVRKNRDEMMESFRNGIKPYVDLGQMHETIAELRDRHQSDCIEINRLHTALEVMTEKYMKLREVHGL